jgi:hypothetical protein
METMTPKNTCILTWVTLTSKYYLNGGENIKRNSHNYQESPKMHFVDPPPVQATNKFQCSRAYNAGALNQLSSEKC